jgi:hypothetical protein
MNEDVRTPAVSCRADCRYFSTYTNTCDYTLMMYRSRGCPRDACTKYEKRSGPRPWNKVTYDPEEFYSDTREDKHMHVPEPPVDPPDSEKYITAGCGHEIYDAKRCLNGGRATHCAECLEDRFMQRSLAERAELLGCEHRAVSFPKRGERCGR